MLPKVKALIELYELEPLPVEQTLFTRTYLSNVEPGIGKPAGTAIVGLYCDEPYSISRFHRLSVDELWHFYAGDPLRLILLYPDGSSGDIIMGGDPLKGHQVQFVVPAGVWQAGHMMTGGSYSLFGCTMAPGFTNDMFEGGTRDRLSVEYPDRAEDIMLLGCDENEKRMPP